MTFYVGGKKKLGVKLAEVMHQFILPGEEYHEYFCGMLGVFVNMQDGQRRLVATDGHKDLMAMWTAIQRGWEPPRRWISREEYYELKELPGADRLPLQDRAHRAFVNFGCSFSGKDWGGWSQPKPTEVPRWERNYQSLMRVVPAVKGARNVSFGCCDYLEHRPRGAVIYLDPPYEGTTGYGTPEAFDHDLFWQQVRRWSKDNLVFVSEQNAPEDFVSLWRKAVTRNMHMRQEEEQIKEEHLFVHQSLLPKLQKRNPEALQELLSAP